MSKSLDDILSSANEHRVERVSHAKVAEESHIYNFIKDNNITEGPDTVPVRFIYALYCDQHRPGIKPKRFSMYFKNYFKKHYSADKSYYRLNRAPFNMPEGYTIWKEQGQRKWKYKKTKYNNLKSTPNGWMIYLEVQGGRQIFGFEGDEVRAAKLADKILWFYYGPNYTKFNFPKDVRTLTEQDPELLELLTLQKDTYGPQKKDSV